MKVLIIANDNDLKKEFDAIDTFENVIMKGKNEFKEEYLEEYVNYDVIIVSDRYINFNEIGDSKFANLNGKCKVYYMLSNYNSRKILENVTAICTKNRINVIPPKLTNKQITETILNDFFSVDYKSNIVTFFGADSKVGTTMIGLSVAKSLAVNSNAKVFFMPLNGRRSVEYIKNDITGIGMDNLKVEIQNQVLTIERLLDNCIKENNLICLPGVDSILDIRHYKPSDIEYLINLASQAANIVIIDGGNAGNLDLVGALSIMGLNVARYKYIVTTQQATSYDSFIRTYDQILKFLKIKEEDFMLIVNKYFSSPGLENPNQLAERYKMTLAGNINHLEFKGWEAEFDRETLLNDDDFKYDIEQLAELIATQLDIKYQNSKPKKGIINKIFR